MKTKEAKPGEVPPMPHWVSIGCNDYWGKADLQCVDLRGERLLFDVIRDGKILSSFALTKGQALQLVMWIGGRI